MARAEPSTCAEHDDIHVPRCATEHIELTPEYDGAANFRQRRTREQFSDNTDLMLLQPTKQSIGIET